MKTKVIKVPASSTRSWWFRPFYRKSMEQEIEKWARKGWDHKNTTPIANHRGRTTHYLLTFEKK